jgi:branched-chain amino acid transport system ATP-binding protein
VTDTQTGPNTEPDTGPLLSASGLSVRFGGLRALHDVDVALHSGRVLGMIGPNGAGKSTLINLLTGHVRRTSGQVVLAGHDITDARPWRIAHAGVAGTRCSPRSRLRRAPPGRFCCR